MRTTRLFYFLVTVATLLLFTQCDEDHASEQAAMKLVEDSYTQLFAGNYEGFLSARVGADSLPADYRSELLISYKHYKAQQESVHGGILGFNANRVVIDTAGHTAQVFLFINYADSLKEEIVVPLVENDGEWKMK